MLHKNIKSILLVAALLPAVACLDMSDAEVESLDAETEEIASTSQEVNSVNTCEQQCSNALGQCLDYCDMAYDPYWEEDRYRYCEDECFDDYRECADEDFRYKAPTNLICHLDVDVHLFDVDIEFYTADAYEDHSCSNQSDRYKKRYVTKVSCSHFSSIFDQSACAQKIDNKFAQLVGQGYIPAVSDADIDQCPTPRL